MANKFKATEKQFRKALLKWLNRQHEQLRANVYGDDDASLWCKEEAELVKEHITTVESLIFVNESLKVSADEAHRQADLAYERIEELEAKLAEVVEALERIEDASEYLGNCPEASETTLRYAHETTRRLASTTLAELTGGKDE